MLKTLDICGGAYWNGIQFPGLQQNVLGVILITKYACFQFFCLDLGNLQSSKIHIYLDIQINTKTFVLFYYTDKTFVFMTLGTIDNILKSRVFTGKWQKSFKEKFRIQRKFPNRPKNSFILVIKSFVTLFKWFRPIHVFKSGSYFHLI